MTTDVAKALAALHPVVKTVAKIRSIEAVKELHDAAEAHVAAAKRAGLPADVQNLLAEISLRAARRAGELLAATPLSLGGRPAKQSKGIEVKTLRELGLSKSQSSRWRRLAAIPAELFEGHLAESRRIGKAPSAARLLRLAKELGRNRPTQPKAATAPATMTDLSESARDLPVAPLAEELVELQEHLDHFGDLIQSVVALTESGQSPGVKRRTISMLREIRETVARLLRRSQS